MPRSPVLMFGFEPFLQFKENPSEKIVRSLNGTSVGGRKIIGRILPVDYGTIEKRILTEIDSSSPSVVIGTGLAAGRSCLSIEKIAVNYKFSEEPDNKGKLQEGDPIDATAPDGIFSNIKPEEAAGKLNMAGIPAAVSLSAGAYLCNFAMFIIARESARRGFVGGFIHLPCDEEMASKSEYRRFPFMSLDSMKRGVRLVIQHSIESTMQTKGSTSAHARRRAKS